MRFHEAARLSRQGIARVRASDGISVLNVRSTPDGFVVCNYTHYEAHMAEEWVERRKDWEPLVPKDAVTRLGELA